MKIYISSKASHSGLLLTILFPLIFSLASFKQNANVRKAKHTTGYIDITVQESRKKSGDTLTLILFDVIQCIGYPKHNLGSYDVIGQNGKFTFHIQVPQSCGYFNIMTNRKTTTNGGSNDRRTLINTCFWEAGDKVQIDITDEETATGIHSKYSFSGKGALKYQLAMRLDSVMIFTVIKRKPVFDSVYNYYDFGIERPKKVLPILEQNKKRLSSLAYDVLKANILFREGRGRFFDIEKYYDQSIRNAAPDIKSKFREKLKETFTNVNTFGVDEKGLLNSQEFLLYTFYKYSILTQVLNDKPDGSLAFEMEKKQLNGALRDKQLIFLLQNYFPASPSQSELYAQAHKVIRDKISRTVLNDLIKHQPGQSFSDFELQDTTGKPVHFSDFRGKTVLIDFWIYSCGGCAKLYQEALKGAEKKFKSDPNVVFISVNSDKARIRWIEGIKLGIYTSTDVINLNTNGLGDSHPVIASNNIMGFPFTMLIDKNGIVRYYDSDDLYHYNTLVAAIGALK